MVLILVGAIVMTRGLKLRPHRLQNMFETFYETLGDFGLGIAGPPAARTCRCSPRSSC